MTSEVKKEQSSKLNKPQRPFPRHTLEEALVVAIAIQDKNAGKPIKPPLLAQALEIKPASSNFRDITSSAFRYGLISGTWQLPNISLTPLGYSITKPKDPKQKIKDLQEAAIKVELFKNIYGKYRDARIPKPTDQFLKNIIEDEFKVPREHVEECLRILFDNGKYAQILRDISGSFFVMFSDETEPAPEVGNEELEEEGEVELPEEEEEEPPKPEQPIKKQVFIAHGKNKKPLEQLKAILSRFKVPFQVAINEPHKGRPISEKVAQLMRECTSGIFIFTGDEETKDALGETVMRPSDNVVFELGAGIVLYGERIVIFREEGVGFGSDFTAYGHITFEKDRLDAKGIELMNELIAQEFFELKLK